MTSTYKVLNSTGMHRQPGSWVIKRPLASPQTRPHMDRAPTQASADSPHMSSSTRSPTPHHHQGGGITQTEITHNSEVAMHLAFTDQDPHVECIFPHADTLYISFSPSISAIHRAGILAVSFPANQQTC